MRPRRPSPGSHSSRRNFTNGNLRNATCYPRPACFLATRTVVGNERNLGTCCPGCLLDRPDFIPALVDAGLTESDFLPESHRRVWRALKSMRQLDTPVDIYSVSQHLDDPHADDIAFLTDLLFGVVLERKHALYHAGLVRKAARLRALASVGEWLSESALARGADPALLIDSALSRLQGVL